MLKPDIAVYRLVSRQTKAAKVSPMKGSFTSAFVLFIRREYTIHASSKKQKPYPKGKAKRREYISRSNMVYPCRSLWVALKMC